MGVNEMIAGFFVGIIFWQLIFTIITFVTKENEDVMACVGIGIWWVPLFVIGKLYRAIRVYYIKNHYNGYRLCVKGNTYGQIYIHNKDVNKFITDETAEYHIKKYSDGKTWKTLPFTSECYKNQKYFDGWEMKKFMKNNTH